MTPSLFAGKRGWLLFLLLFVSCFSNAQTGVVRVRRFQAGYDYQFKHVMRSHDGNILALGANENYSSERASVTKLDTALNTIWETFVDIDGYELNDFAETNDGGVIACGTNKNWGQGRREDAFVVKFDIEGNISWQKFYGGTDQDFGNAIRQLANGHYIMLAEVNSADGDVTGKPLNASSDIWMVELDGNGSIVSQRFFGGSNAENVAGMQVTDDGGLIFAGTTASSDGQVSGKHDTDYADIWIVKLRNDFSIEWSKCIGGAYSDAAESICRNAAGGYLVSGVSGSNDGDFAGSEPGAVILKINDAGDLVWIKSINGGNEGQEIINVKSLSNGDILAIGYTNSYQMPDVSFPANHTDSEGLLFRLNAQGQIIWSKAIGGSTSDLCYDVMELPNGNVLASGGSTLNATDGDFTGFPAPGAGLQAFLMEIRNLNSIKGTLFFDVNNNNQKEPAEQYITNASVITTGSQFTVQMPSLSGRFLQSVDKGTYNTHVNNTNNAVFDPLQFAITPKSKQTVFTGTSQTDSFSFRVVPIGLVKDLAVNIAGTSETFSGNSARFRISFRNLGGAALDTVDIALVTDSNSVYQSSGKPVLSNNAGVITWRYFNVSAFEKDTLDVTVHINPVPGTKPGDSIALSVLAYPLVTDFDSTDNRATAYSVVKAQNDAISNTGLQFIVTDSARVKRTIPYSIFYHFNSQLDSTKGEIRMVKDAKTTYLVSIPVPSRVAGDTLLWNFKDLHNNNADTIIVNLAVSDTPAVHIGDYIHQELMLRFNTTDTAVITLQKTINQRINGYFIPQDNTNTTLSYPNGIQWTRSFGGSGQDIGNGVLALPDSGFIIAGSTRSKNFDIVTGADSLDAFIARYDRNGHVKWIKTFGGPLDDAFLSLARSGDGNFLAAGYTGQKYFDSSSIGDAWVVKFNINGDTLWTKTYGGSNQETIYSIAATEDGGSVFTGNTESNDGDVSGHFQADPFYKWNTWVVKLTSTGAIQWQHCYTDSLHASNGISIKVLSDKNYLVGCNLNGSYPDEWRYYASILKLTPAGDKLWEKIFGDADLDYSPGAVLENADGTFMVSGVINTAGLNEDVLYTGVHGGVEDIWVAKFDQNGSKIWEKFFGGTSYDNGSSLIRTSDGNYVVAGGTTSNNGNVTGFHGAVDGWLLKVDASGKLLWQKTVGGAGFDAFNAVAELSDGSILATGNTDTNNDGDVFGGHGNTDVLIAKIGQSNLITGKVFVDRNKNLVQDGDDIAVNKGVVITSKDNLNYSGIVNNGMYSISVDTGAYHSRLVTADSAYYEVYPITAVSNFNGYVQTDTVNFALLRKKDIRDLKIDLIATNTARPGFSAYYVLNYENRGTVPVNNTSVQLILDNRASYVSSDIPYTQINGDTISWNTGSIEDLAPAKKINIQLKLESPPVISNGDSLVLKARILPLENDTIPADNEVVIRQQVRGSFDPNGKEEIHGNSLPAAGPQQSEYLTYIIRFQNTGTDTAFGVHVRDTLSNKVDWNSIEMVAASHNYELTISDGNKLEWYFRNIQLPDSNTNEPASHGYLAFRVKPRQGLLTGDSITNQAAVYFDFNLPVITNMARTFITSLLALPSQLLSFEAVKQNGIVLLQWRVTNEMNVKDYQVERSADGKDYIPIGKVAAVNKNNITSYSFNDNASFPGVNYYRLKVVDRDGKSSYSYIVLVNDRAGHTGFTIFPNPVSDKVAIGFGTTVKGHAVVSVTDVQGRLLFAKDAGYVNTSFLEVPFDFTSLPGGVYVIRCKIGEQTFSGKLIKN